MTQYVNDTFTEASDTALASHTPDAGGAWTAVSGSVTVIGSEDKIHGDSSTASGFYKNGATPGSADYAVEAAVSLSVWDSTANAAVCARIQTDGTTYYLAQMFGGDATTGRISLIVNPSNTSLGTYTIPSWTAGQVYNLRLEIVGSLLKVYLDGSLVITATDTSISAAGKAGIRSRLNGRIDNFIWEDAGIKGDASISVDGTGDLSGSGAAIAGAADISVDGTGDLTSGGGPGALAGAASVSVDGASDLSVVPDVLAGDASVSIDTNADLTVPIIIEDNFERSSVNVSLSSVVGAGDSAVIRIKPRAIRSEVRADKRWLTPVARVRGVGGFRPTFEILDYFDGDNGYHGFPWQSTRKLMFSYDTVTWAYFDTTTADASAGVQKITARHGTAFTQDTVYVSRSRTWNVTQQRAWAQALKAANPTRVYDLAGGTNCVVGTFTTQTDELGRTVPACNLLGFYIRNDSVARPDGAQKPLKVITWGIHAGEDMGDIVARYMAEFLVTSAAPAQSELTYFDYLFVGPINAPGRTGGGWRGSNTNWATMTIDDGNRHFSDVSPGLEIVTLPRTVLQNAIGNRVVAHEIDSHGTYLNKWSFFQDSGSLQHPRWDTALEAAPFSQLVTDEGESVSGFLAKWVQNTYHVPFYITLETGDPSPVTDADLQAFGEQQIRAADALGFNTFTAQAMGDANVSIDAAANLAGGGVAMSGAADISIDAIADLTAPASGGILAGDANVSIDAVGDLFVVPKALIGDANISVDAIGGLIVPPDVLGGDAQISIDGTADLTGGHVAARLEGDASTSVEVSADLMAPGGMVPYGGVWRVPRRRIYSKAMH